MLRKAMAAAALLNVFAFASPAPAIACVPEVSLEGEDGDFHPQVQEPTCF